ncbi:MAG: acid phosphatase [Lasallia pustulata]|uniref:Acid phosphatase n=1 Tax=Lasallia pustulata TaxID=136370 RepID=A0A5M8PF44_9LECA|nr:MAG: acid phosphatase [Lasallia pustulata]
MIAVLWKYAKSPLPAWPFKILLNSLVSVFATITKGCLLVAVAEAISQLKLLQYCRSQRTLINVQTYDDASREVWDALKLLFSLGLQQLVSLGALITVLPLAIRPFTQEVTSYPMRKIQTGSPQHGGPRNIRQRLPECAPRLVN